LAKFAKRKQHNTIYTATTTPTSHHCRHSKHHDNNPPMISFVVPAIRAALLPVVGCRGRFRHPQQATARGGPHWSSKQPQQQQQKQQQRLLLPGEANPADTLIVVLAAFRFFCGAAIHPIHRAAAEH
jgi:hypothetical protein